MQQYGKGNFLFWLIKLLLDRCEADFWSSVQVPQLGH